MNDYSSNFTAHKQSVLGLYGAVASRRIKITRIPLRASVPPCLRALFDLGYGSAALLTLLLFIASGCATQVIPPSAPKDPIVFYVADYGRHSSIFLPTGEGGLIEYAYGDWDYFALNKYRWYTGASALFFSECSGLGRRIVNDPNNDESLRQMVSSKRIIRIQTERRKVLELLHELDERYCSRIDSLIYNRDQTLYFVKDDSQYGLFHTCNGATAEWLTKLGCEVKGWPVVLSNFEVPDSPFVSAEKNSETAQVPRDKSSGDPVNLSQ